MQEFEIDVQQSVGSITTNFEEVKAALKEEMSAYKNLIVTEDNIKDSKKDLAFLRKIEKSLDERRKEIKKSFMEPYNKFEMDYKDLVTVIQEPIKAIDTQLKAFDEQRAALKLEHVKEVYADTVGELAEYLPFDKVFDSKWLNATAKDQDIIYDLQEKTLRVKNDLQVIKSLSSEIEDEILKVYKSNNNDLASAVQRNTQFVADKNRVQEQIKAEQPKEEPKPTIEPTSTGSLNDMVEAIKTVSLVISKADLQQAMNCLNFANIHYNVVEN